MTSNNDTPWEVTEVPKYPTTRTWVPINTFLRHVAVVVAYYIWVYRSDTTKISRGLPHMTASNGVQERHDQLEDYC